MHKGKANFKCGQRSRNDSTIKHPDEIRPKPNKYQRSSEDEGR